MSARYDNDVTSPHVFAAKNGSTSLVCTALMPLSSIWQRST